MDDYKVSLVTILCYYQNFCINAKELFDSLELPIIRNPPMTKKGKEVDIKSIVTSSGTIISAKSGNWIKGIDPKPFGEYNYHVEIKGKIQIFKDTYNPDKYHDKGKLIKMEKLGIKTKKSSFPNQITINYAYKTGQNINMFIFRKNIKFAGFQSEKYAIKMIKKMWVKHMLKNPAAITFFSTGPPSLIFEASMTNSTFKTNYNFVLTKVNTLMHALKEKDNLILNSDFETTIDNGVKITLKAIKPENYAFNEIIWENGQWTDSISLTIDGRNKSADDEKKSTICLYNEKFVVSTRYGVILKTTSEYIDNILEQNKSSLEVVKHDNIKKYQPCFI